MGWFNEHFWTPLNNWGSKIFGGGPNSNGGGTNINIGYSTTIDSQQIANYENTIDYTQNGGQNMSNTAGKKDEDYTVPLITTAAQIGYNAWESKQNRKFNEAEAQKQRNWEANLANTAHQREIADLQAAGLNPLLSASGGNGADTPSGASASSAGNMPIDMASILNTALTGAQIENVRADTDLKYKNSGKTEKEIETMEINNRINQAVSRAEIALKNAQTNSERVSAKKTLVDTVAQEYYNWHIQKYGSAPDTTATNKALSKLEKFLTNATNWSGTKITNMINEMINTDNHDGKKQTK